MRDPFVQLTEVQLVALQPALVTPNELTLTADRYTLGRIAACNIVVRHPLTSRLHARIERQGPRYLLADAGSVNGTFVNGRRIADHHLLANDDMIALGVLTPMLRFIDPDATICPGDMLTYDERGMQFLIDDIAIALSPMQFRLLRHLHKHAGDVCSRESCAQAMWGRDYDPGMDAGALDQAVSSLRRALRQVAPDANLIETRRDLGYLLRLGAESYS